jgi:secondary thiamine-phosphate synthase enzyme
MEQPAMIELNVRSVERTQLINITGQIAAALDGCGQDSRLCHVFVPHTTAAVVINESADPDVARDLSVAYQAMVPEVSFAHAEGNSDAHYLATLLGSSVSIPVENRRLKLGTWQGVFFVDLDGPRRRRVWVQII